MDFIKKNKGILVFAFIVALLIFSVMLLLPKFQSQVAITFEVIDQKRIGAAADGWSGTVPFDAEMGFSVENIGDLNKDGFTDLAIGAYNDNVTGPGMGSVWIVFLNGSQQIIGQQKIDMANGGFTGPFTNDAHFGTAVESIGDLDGDGVNDLAVGAFSDYNGGVSTGSVFILFMNTDGTVKSDVKIAEGLAGLKIGLQQSDGFGAGIGALGDLNKDKTVDIIVGALGDDQGANGGGAAYVLFLNPDGTVKATQKITEGIGGFTGDLDDNDQIGRLTAIPDLDGDGIVDVAVGAFLDDDGGLDAGAIYIWFMNTDGTVKSHEKISSTTKTGMFGMFTSGDNFGSGSGFGQGAGYVMLMNTDGTVRESFKISNGKGGLPDATLDDVDSFGIDMTGMGDLDGNGYLDIAAGAWLDWFPTLQSGSVWLMYADHYLYRSHQTKPTDHRLGYLLGSD